MTDLQWRNQTRKLFAKHNRAGYLMMRKGIKKRVEKKWFNAYMRYFYRIPDPETCIDTYTEGGE